MTAILLATAVAPGVVRAPAQTASPQTQPTTAPEPDVNVYFDGLAKTASEAPTSAQRFDAAQRLVESRSPHARDLVTQLLSGADDRTKTVCAHAIATGTYADTQWVQSLKPLLKRDRITSDFAAQALSRYEALPLAYGAVIEAAKGEPAANRLGAVVALGSVVQKPSAQTLVSIVGDSALTAELRIAADASLTHLSGQVASGDPVSFWNGWLVARNEPDVAWRQRVLGEQHNALQTAEVLLRDRLTALRAAVNQREQNLYNAEQQPQRKTDMLLELLKDPDPDLRAAGTFVAQDVSKSIRGLPQPVKERIIELLGDPSREVRLGVATVLSGRPDTTAFDALRLQLEIETDLPIKLLLVKAIASDDKAIPVLKKLAAGAFPPIAAAAVDALSSATSLQTAAQSVPTIDFLRQTLQQRTGPSGQPAQDSELINLRAHLVRAMGNLAANSPTENLIYELFGFTDDSEPPVVREAALQGLGAIGPPAGDRVGDRIIQQDLTPALESDPRIRAAAARALGAMGKFVYYNKVDARTNPAEESNPEVRAAARDAASRLLTAATLEQVAQAVKSLTGRKEYERAVEALGVESDKLNAKPDKDQNDETNYALAQEQIAEIYLNNLDKPALAIRYYAVALAFHENHNAPQFTIDRLRIALLRSYLAAGEFSKALDFSQKEIHREGSAQESLSPLLTTWASRLADSPQSKGAARQLIEMILERKAAGTLSIDDQYISMLHMELDKLPPAPVTQPAR